MGNNPQSNNEGCFDLLLSQLKDVWQSFASARPQTHKLLKQSTHCTYSNIRHDAFRRKSKLKAQRACGVKWHLSVSTHICVGRKQIRKQRRSSCWKHNSSTSEELLNINPSRLTLGPTSPARWFLRAAGCSVFRSHKTTTNK
ncbi:hypothetical protein CRENBAI_005397 [Crenichthys baileyi]|uniref:Uncharacterized protein n=1 Tax=Crenichthys baileyi TaxID=28760 RepID=A0AAV9RVA6_9TELE